MTELQVTDVRKKQTFCRTLNKKPVTIGNTKDYDIFLEDLENPIEVGLTGFGNTIYARIDPKYIKKNIRDTEVVPPEKGFYFMLPDGDIPVYENQPFADVRIPPGTVILLNRKPRKIKEKPLDDILLEDKYIDETSVWVLIK